MKTTSSYYSLIGFLLLAASFHGLLSGSDTFQVDIDVAQFRYNEDANYLEVYYAFDKTELTYIQRREQFEGGVQLHGKITKVKDESVVLDRTWLIPHVVSDTSRLTPGKTSVGVIGLEIPRAECTFTVQCVDEQDSSRYTKFAFHIPPKSFSIDHVAVSDLELSSSIRKAKDKDRSTFCKNTFEVIPNPGRVYGENMPSLYYYVEVYNLLASSREGEYNTRAVVYGAKGKELIVRKRTKPKVNDSSVEIGSINVSSLPSGFYKLYFSVVDSVANVTVISMKDFLVRQSRQTALPYSELGFDPFMMLEYEGITEDALDREFDMARYITLDFETSLYQSLSSLETKKGFLSNFWKKRDPDPSSPQSEFKLEYFDRVQHANIHFSIGPREGWKTDRGRVYIVYGPPDEYERHFNERGMRPYEVWYYHDIQGGVKFVFADIFGMRDYLLVHSTHRNELRDEYWLYKVREY